MAGIAESQRRGASWMAVLFISSLMVSAGLGAGWILGQGDIVSSSTGGEQPSEVTVISLKDVKTEDAKAAIQQKATRDRVMATPAPQPPDPPSTQEAARSVVVPAARRPERRVLTKTAEPKATALRQVPAPRGTLSVTARPWVEVWVDGKRLAAETPLRSAGVLAGRRRVRFVNPALGLDITRTVTVPANQQIGIFVDAPRGTVALQLGSQSR